MDNKQQYETKPIEIWGDNDYQRIDVENVWITTAELSGELITPDHSLRIVNGSNYPSVQLHIPILYYPCSCTYLPTYVE